MIDKQLSIRRGFQPLVANKVLRASLGATRSEIVRRLGLVLLVDPQLGDGEGHLATSLPMAIERLGRCVRLGIRHVKIFIVNLQRDASASAARDASHFGIDLIKRFKDRYPDVAIHVETCLCPFTESGACVIHSPNGRAVDPRTFERLCDLATNQALGGADVLGLSSMLPGAIRAIGARVRAEGCETTALVPHLILKSSLYSQFAHASGIARHNIDRGDLQLDPTHRDVAIMMARSFADEGADMILFEPALWSMDLVAEARRATSLPSCAFCVSGESFLLGPDRPEPLRRDYLTALVRSGHEIILSYHAESIATEVVNVP